MDLKVNRRIAVGVAGLALAAGGGGIAVAAGTGGGNGAKEREAYLDDAAKTLNVTPEKLESALEGAYEARLAQAVKDGRLTQEQADRLKERLAKGGVPVPGVGGPGGGFGGPGFGAFRHGGFAGGPGGIVKQGAETAAKYLGVSTDDLFEALHDGKSLADVAKAQNKDVAGLKAALVAFARTEIADAVKDKKLTQAQADRILKDLDARVADVVDGKRPQGRGGRGPGLGGGPGHGWGHKRP